MSAKLVCTVYHAYGLIHFKYSMVRSDFEIPGSFIVETSKQGINFNTGCATNESIWKQLSKRLPLHKQGEHSTWWHRFISFFQAHLILQ